MRNVPNTVVRAAILVLPVGFSLAGAALAGSPLTYDAYTLLNQRAGANAAQFFVYQDADSGFNHGFPSGFFGSIDKISINAACIDDPAASDGCSTDPTRLDQVHGTVVQVSFAPLGPGEFAGLDFEEPQGFVSTNAGIGYNLTGANAILFDVRSPTGITVQFGAGGSTTNPVPVAASDGYATACVAVAGPAAQVCPADAAYKLDMTSPMDLASVHLLFTVVTNVQQSPGGGVILLDNIRYTPVPSAQAAVPSLPLSTQTFGVVPAQQAQAGPVPFPPDQVNRNIATIYEASLTIMALFARDTGTNNANAVRIADALVYALGHDNSGDPLPGAPNGARGLHNAYESGDLALLNSQGAGAGQAGQVRFAGFSAANAGCGSSGYCLVLDGATGGNNAFAILALLKAYKHTGNTAYLFAALEIGRWIYDRLLDTSGTGYGGYFVGFPDQGVTPKRLETGKSTENNADIFAAFSALARAVDRLGGSGDAHIWRQRAKVAGDFVIAMFDAQRGCLNAGTVLAGTGAGAGVDASGPQSGNDVINQFDFLDSNSFVYLAMAQSPQYAASIDWSRVAACLDHFRTRVYAASTVFRGYGLTRSATSGPNGIAWEFTGQAVVVVRLAGGDPGPLLGELRHAKTAAPFADNLGLVAATLDHGDSLPPLEQCLSTPFQCIPERVGIAATAWAIFAETGFNPFRDTPR